ncbi:MAG: sulfotransferase domain-containing protein [Terriglobia bacterium]
MTALRIAIVSMPRSGNTWVRRVLSEALGLEQIAVHNPLELPATLPTRMALQIHWYREPRFQAFLRSNDFRTIVLARHPLDVLISVLHFTRREPLTARWLEGNAELPPDFAQHTPASPAFLSYATSWGAENLLSVSYQWWHERDALRACYEELVREPYKGFDRLVEQLGESPAAVPRAIDANPFKVLQETSNRHGWQGTPGLWRKLIPPFDARRIYCRHRIVFQALGYTVPPYLLTRRAALRNWQQLAL